jgi:hypothetical protein
MGHTDFKSSNAIEERLARGLMTWGLIGGAVGCMAGALWAGVEGALCGGTVLSSLAIAAYCVLAARRERRAPAHASLHREHQSP